MNKYLIAGVLGVGCLYAATSMWSHRVHQREHAQHNFDVAAARDKKNIIDIAAIGSGPAALTACVYGCRAGRQVVCFSGSEPGGLLKKTTLVENWPGEISIQGPEIIRRLWAQAEAFGTHFIPEDVVETDFSTYPYRLKTHSGLEFYAFSVIVATGATPKKLGIPGEETYWGNGVSTCAVCDGSLTKGQNVVVVGGGDSAIEEAIQLAPYAQSITIMVRGESMRAAQSMQDRLVQYPSITVRYNVSIQEIVGDDQGVTGIVVRDNKTGVVTQEPIFAVFLAIGHIPNIWMLGDQLELSKTGHILLCDHTQTSVTGVFAAGDVADARYRQAGVAAGDGIKAALDADRFLVEIGYSQAVAREFDNIRFSPVGH